MTIGLQIRHRISALRDAVAQFEDRGRYLAHEAVAVPLRPVVAFESRRRHTSPAEEWARLGGRVGYLQRHRLHDGRRLWVRHGTADTFTVAEVLARSDYAIPAEARNLVPPRPKVLDLGGNIGMFGIRALRDFGPSRITAIEADRFNADILRRNAHEQRGFVEWQVIEGFAATSDSGTVRFAAGHFAESRGETSGTAVPSVDALPLMGDADLAKIDIEGAEWPILHDDRLGEMGPQVIVLEYHRWGCPAGQDPSSTCRELLASAGYECRDAGSVGMDFGTLWAWRPSSSATT
jgi:FkbM family methyltransferase